LEHGCCERVAQPLHHGVDDKLGRVLCLARHHREEHLARGPLQRVPKYLRRQRARGGAV
jgi:hypothetical protein